MSDRTARRRRPQQERSREMVERILAAARSVLVECGYEGASTNRVAAAAGISPGSLYQYFRDKDAVVDETLDRYLEELEARITRAFLASLAGAEVADRVRAAIAAILDAFEDQPALLAVATARDPRAHDDRRARFARRIDEIVTVALRGRPGAGDDPRAPETVAWVVVRGIEHVTLSYVLERPRIDREVIVDELAAMVVGYVQTPGVRPVATPPG